jgi:hypothetical protein
MHGQFDSPITLGAPVQVGGPLSGVDPKAYKATIVCVLVQGTVWAEGTGTWTKGNPKWTGTVDLQGHVIGGGPNQLQPLREGEARGIAMAVVVKEEPQPPGGGFVPPSIDTLTWCVDVTLQ